MVITPAEARFLSKTIHPARMLRLSDLIRQAAHASKTELKVPFTLNQAELKYLSDLGYVVFNDDPLTTISWEYD